MLSLNSVENVIFTFQSTTMDRTKLHHWPTSPNASQIHNYLHLSHIKKKKSTRLYRISGNRNQTPNVKTLTSIRYNHSSKTLSSSYSTRERLLSCLASKHVPMYQLLASHIEPFNMSIFALWRITVMPRYKIWGFH